MPNDLQQVQEVEKFFSDFSAKWSTLYGAKRGFFWRWFDRTFRWSIYERYARTFAALGNDLTNRTVLDVGCGNGVYAFEAARRGAPFVLGVDVAEGMIALCNEQRRQLGLENATKFICTPFPPCSAVPEIERKLNVAIVMGVMDYIPDPVPFLEAVRKRISEFALITFPAKDWLRWPLRRWRYRLLKRCAVFHYHESQVKEACARAGFGRLEVRRIAWTGSCYFVRASV
jgi:2-polyprenyl-3-methyl-5-hydroxy-6-metoxy-1,4-benzoquinol methylase